MTKTKEEKQTIRLKLIEQLADAIANGTPITEGDTTDSCDMNFFEPEKHMRGDENGKS